MGCAFSAAAHDARVFRTFAKAERARSSNVDERFWGIVANDGTKDLLRDFVVVYKDIVSSLRLCGTGTTSQMLQLFNLKLGQVYKSGPLGGDQELAAMITQGKVCGLIFFVDPLAPHMHAHDISSLCRICDVYQIYLCTTYRTAAAVINVHWNSQQRLMHGGRKDPEIISRSGRRGSVVFSHDLKFGDDNDEGHEDHEDAYSGRPRLALVAHDSMLPLVRDLVSSHLEVVRSIQLVGTEAMGQFLHGNFGISLDEQIPTSRLGGSTVLGAMMAQGRLTGLLMFCNPLTAQTSFDDSASLLRLCRVYQKLCGTNYRTASAILEFVGMKQSIVCQDMRPSEQLTESYRKSRTMLIRSVRENERSTSEIVPGAVPDN